MMRAVLVSRELLRVLLRVIGAYVSDLFAVCFNRERLFAKFAV